MNFTRSFEKFRNSERHTYVTSANNTSKLIKISLNLVSIDSSDHKLSIGG